MLSGDTSQPVQQVGDEACQTFSRSKPEPIEWRIGPRIQAAVYAVERSRGASIRSVLEQLGAWDNFLDADAVQ